MRLPFKIYITRNWPTKENRILIIELGKWWTIKITRQLVEDKFGFDIYKAKWNKGILKALRQGEIIPYWYGFARYDYNIDCGIYAPIPINLIIAGWNWFGDKILWRIKYSLPYRRNIIKETIDLAQLVLEAMPFPPEYRMEIDKTISYRIAESMIKLGYRRIV